MAQAQEHHQHLLLQQHKRKRSRPGSSFSSDDDDEVSDILLAATSAQPDKIDAAACPTRLSEGSSSSSSSIHRRHRHKHRAPAVPVQFSATPPQDLPLPRPGRAAAPPSPTGDAQDGVEACAEGASDEGRHSQSSGSRPTPPKTLHFNSGAVLPRFVNSTLNSSQLLLLFTYL